ncbi:MAG: hypothetical protein AAFR14_03465, partial [Bacteroidota bacterium]
IEFVATKPFDPNIGDVAIDNVIVCSTADPIPTLGQWSLIIMVLTFMVVGVIGLRSYSISLAR